jgi:hypothetical protein
MCLPCAFRAYTVKSCCMSVVKVPNNLINLICHEVSMKINDYLLNLYAAQQESAPDKKDPPINHFPFLGCDLLIALPNRLIYSFEAAVGSWKLPKISKRGAQVVPRAPCPHTNLFSFKLLPRFCHAFPPSRVAGPCMRRAIIVVCMLTSHQECGYLTVHLLIMYNFLEQGTLATGTLGISIKRWQTWCASCLHHVGVWSGNRITHLFYFSFFLGFFLHVLRSDQKGILSIF